MENEKHPKMLLPHHHCIVSVHVVFLLKLLPHTRGRIRTTKTKSKRFSSANLNSRTRTRNLKKRKSHPMKSKMRRKRTRVTTKPSALPSVPPSSMSLPVIESSRLALGHFHSCVIDTFNNIKCWGFDAFGQLGDGTVTNRNTPTIISIDGDLGLARGKDFSSSSSSSHFATQISLGFAHTCAIDNLNRLMCWGNNGQGQLGIGETATAINHLTPTLISLDNDIGVAQESSSSSSFAIQLNELIHEWKSSVDKDLSGVGRVLSIDEHVLGIISQYIVDT